MNANLLQLLLGAMTAQSSVNSISGKTGLSGKQIQKLILLALPLLIKYMTGNASSGSGALSLLGALSQHTSKKGMDRQLAEADEKDGSKIIGHILGKNEGKVTQDLCAQTGLNASQIQQVLSIIAPALMSGISEAAAASTKPAASSKKPAAASKKAAASSKKPAASSKKPAASSTKPASADSAGTEASGMESSLLSGLSGQGIFGALLGLGKDAKDGQNSDSAGASSNGTALLEALLKAAGGKS